MSRDASVQETELQVNLIINSDLHMSSGKIASQAAHAVHLMTDTLQRHRESATRKLMVNYDKWFANGAKIIVLQCSGEELRKLSERQDVFYVKDAGRTEVEAGSLTAVCTLPSTEKLPYRLL